MFTETDVKNIFGLFPPQKTSDFFPSLTLSPSGNGFVTLQFVQAQFRSRVTKDTQRISLSDLADELDVDQQLVQQLTQNHPKLALFSADGLSIITADERDALYETLTTQLFDELVSKSDFIAHHDVHVKSLEILLSDQKYELSIMHGCVYSDSYESRVATDIHHLLLDGLEAVEIKSEDIVGSPPLWFISHILSQGPTPSSFSIKETSTSITVLPNLVLEKKRDATIKDLQTGATAYIDIQELTKDFPELFSTYEDAHSYIRSVRDISVTDRFAISTHWIIQLGENCSRVLEEEGSLSISEIIGSRLPTGLRNSVASTAETCLIAAWSKNPEAAQITRVGEFLLTDTRRQTAMDSLSSYAQASAETQWAALTTSPSNPPDDLKYNLSAIQSQIPAGHRFLYALLLEPGVKKMLDETFYLALTTLESQNEALFQTYWNNSINARYTIHMLALSPSSTQSSTQSSPSTDEKLFTALEDLYTTYFTSTFLPSALSKAKSQGLLLSRRTRKNVGKLEAELLSIQNPTVPVQGSEKEKESGIKITVLTKALATFMKRQSIPAPTASLLSTVKQEMVEEMRRDMHRRLSKSPPKTADGPVLFLTLVLVLWAKEYNGVLYATGKFAPKLLKLLKGVLGEDMYEKLERWKEAAKAGTLNAEDKAEMVRMAEA